MTSITVERKVEGGKFFRIKVQLEHGNVKGLSLTGDFFLFPEEGLETLERILLLCASMTSREQAVRRLKQETRSQGIEMVGMTSRDLVDALWEVRG